MKVAIVGTRIMVMKDAGPIGTAFDGLSPKDIVFTGDAKGVDYYVRMEAADRGHPLAVLPANWTRYGKSAGPIRNEVLVSLVDRVIAFPSRAGSPGTNDVIRRARERGIPVDIIEVP